MRALMTQNSCAVGMRDAKLGNHLNWEDEKRLAFKTTKNLHIKDKLELKICNH